MKRVQNMENLCLSWSIMYLQLKCVSEASAALWQTHTSRWRRCFYSSTAPWFTCNAFYKAPRCFVFTLHSLHSHSFISSSYRALWDCSPLQWSVSSSDLTASNLIWSSARLSFRRTLTSSRWSWRRVWRASASASAGGGSTRWTCSSYGWQRTDRRSATGGWG